MNNADDLVNKDLVKILKKVFTNKILTQSYFQYKYNITKEALNINIEGAKEYIKTQCIHKFCQFIINHKSVKDIDFIESGREDGTLIYDLEIMVMKKSELKFVVEACIRQMDLETINKIREEKDE